MSYVVTIVGPQASVTDFTTFMAALGYLTALRFAGAHGTMREWRSDRPDDEDDDFAPPPDRPKPEKP